MQDQQTDKTVMMEGGGARSRIGWRETVIFVCVSIKLYLQKPNQLAIGL